MTTHPCPGPIPPEFLRHSLGKDGVGQSQTVDPELLIPFLLILFDKGFQPGALGESPSCLGLSVS